MRVLVAMAMLAATAASGETAKTADYTFAYSYPAEAAAIPALRKSLEADRADIRAQTAREAAEARRDARDSKYPFHAWDTQKTWKVVTTTPRFLSLSLEGYTFTGGAHGTPFSGSLIWDKQRRDRLEPQAVFTSLAALQRAIPDYCARLKAVRARRIAPYVDTGTTFATCPTLKELTLLLGSTDRKRINRIGLIADPYVVGSYAEGAYEVTLPVTPAIVAAVKPAYRTAFAAR
jgi:hypothetical protein